MKTYVSLAIYCAALIAGKDFLSQFFTQVMSSQEITFQERLPRIGEKLLSYPRFHIKNLAKLARAETEERFSPINWKIAKASQISEEDRNLFCSVQETTNP